MGESLDDERYLVVQRGDLAQAGCVLGVLCKGHHLLAQRVFDCNLNVVDRGSSVLVEFFVDTNGIRKLDRIHRAGVGPDAIGNLGEEHLVAAEDLGSFS